MIEALARFVSRLRQESCAVSPAEVLDASRALDLVGLERRSAVKAALRATLAKDRKSARTFDRLFDEYFTAPKVRVAGEGQGRAAAAGDARPKAESGRSDRGKPKPETEPSRSRTEPRRSGSDPSPRPASQIARPGERSGSRLRKLRRRLAPADPSDPARHDLARRMTTEEEKKIAREVPRMIQELKLRRSRRGEAARSGRPWMRRLLRDNLRHGGVPFLVPYRAPKRKRTRVVLLVDVSFSVARSAGLFLLIASAFIALGRRARVLVFVDRPVDATRQVARWALGASRTQPAPQRKRRGPRPGEGIVRQGVSFADLLDGLPTLNLDAPSDYGRAFHALAGMRSRPQGRDTVLVVLGDGRTNRFDPLAWSLAETARGLAGVLWLVPEPHARWGTADSALPTYAESVDVLVEAPDLAGLARGVGELIRRL